MKLRTTILLLALAAMFTFSTPAEAQWGSLIKGARKTLGIKTKKEKREEAALKEVYDQTFGKGGNRNLSSENLYSVNYKIVDEAVKCLDRAAGYRFSYGSHSGSPVGLYVTGAGHEAFREVRDNAEIAPTIAKVAGYKK